MSWRTVVVESRAKLDYKMGSLVIRSNENIKKIHIGDIQILILESTTISLTCALLQALVEAKVKVVFCNDKRFPMSELVPLHTAHNSSQRIKEQINWSQDVKDEVWNAIVRTKIMNQAKVLAYKELEEVNLLYGYLDELQVGDDTKWEGHAAKVYFNAIFGQEFSRKKENAINAALDYGYTILLSSVNREITASGYITELGLCHRGPFNPYNFGSDLVELLRGFVDEWVIKNQPTEFTKDVKHALVGLLEKPVIINGHTEVLTAAIRIYCHSVFNALNKGDLNQLHIMEFHVS